MNPAPGIVVAFSMNLYADLSDMLSYDFMRYAFAAGVVVSLLSGLVGYFIVLRRLTFAGEALSHVAFAAALGGVILGIDPLIGMFVVTILLAVVMSGLSESARSHDVAVGTVLAWVLGLGALFLSIYTSSPSGGSNGQIGVNVLFGSILGLQPQQVQSTAVVGLVAAVVMIVIARPLLFASVDSAVAAARGVPVRLLSMLFLAVVAVTVAASVQVVGALLVLALLVLPAATAQRITDRPFRAMAISSALALVFTCAGVAAGYYAPYPISFLITSLAFAGYLLALAAGYVRTFVGTRSIRRTSVRAQGT